MQVWLNGEFVGVDEARVSAFDAGFQHGVGLFETMLARNGYIFRAEAHMDRLNHSATELRLTERLHTDALLEAIQQTLEKNNLKDARIRLTLTGGDLNLLTPPTAKRPKSAVDPTIVIQVQPLQKYPDGFFNDGVVVSMANGRLNPLDPMAGHKTLNYWARLQALQDAAHLGAAEAIWFTVSNHLASGSVSNMFLVKNEILFTPIARGEEEEIARDKPTLPSAVLPGITRNEILEIASEKGLRIDRKLLDINDILMADEVFLTNSSWGVLPVVQMEREKINTGKVGEITKTMRQEWLTRTTSS